MTAPIDIIAPTNSETLRGKSGLETGSELRTDGIDMTPHMMILGRKKPTTKNTTAAIAITRILLRAETRDASSLIAAYVIDLGPQNL